MAKCHGKILMVIWKNFKPYLLLRLFQLFQHFFQKNCFKDFDFKTHFQFSKLFVINLMNFNFHNCILFLRNVNILIQKLKHCGKVPKKSKSCMEKCREMKSVPWKKLKSSEKYLPLTLCQQDITKVVLCILSSTTLMSHLLNCRVRDIDICREDKFSPLFVFKF